MVITAFIIGSVFYFETESKVGIIVRVYIQRITKVKNKTKVDVKLTTLLNHYSKTLVAEILVKIQVYNI